MSLTELTHPPSSAYPVAELSDHLRLGTGFADDGSEDAVLERYLRAAIAAIEGRVGRVVLTKRFQWEISRWFSTVRQGLPLAPVRLVESVSILTQDGTESQVAPTSYVLRADSQRPSIAARTALPVIPVNGAAKIVFSAGFDDSWAGVPSDLQQAVLALAAHFYERRYDGSGLAGVMPFGVLALLQRYRPVRLAGDAL